MDYNSYKKYFLPTNNIGQIIGCFIMACAIPFFFIRFGGIYMGVITIAIGACVFVFAKGTRPSDSELDSACETKIKDIEDTARHGIDIREKLIKAFPPVTFSEYDYSGEDKYSEEFTVQRGADGKYRSNRYSSAVILFAQEKLHLYMLQFSLTSANEEEKFYEAKYTDLLSSSIEMRHTKFTLEKGTKKEHEASVEYRAIVIRDNKENIVFEMPVHDGADVDKTVETINRLITSKKEGTVEFN